MGDRSSVRIAENFLRNLDGIRHFLEEAGVPEAYDRLLDELFETVIPTLEELPEIGINFLERRPGSQEGAVRIERLRRRLGAGDTVREFIFGNYLILYAARSRDPVIRLAIKHHRQLSFDLRGHWGKL